jgi:glucose/arabinose dehydrogenase
VWRYNLAGGEKTLIASGFRNTEKLVRRPGTNEVWGWDIGSDNFGSSLGESGSNRPFTDHNPPEEFNRIVEGGFYGHPFIMGNMVPRYEFLGVPDLVTLGAETILPEWTLGAHWTAIGCTFITGDHFPADHKGDCIVACRGSWNSTVRVGYSVERILFDAQSGRPYGGLRLVDTLTADRTTVLARPVDCVEAPDGTILFSCSITSKIFRISFLGRNSHMLVR